MQTGYNGLNLGGGLVYRKCTITYADLTTAGTSQAITLFTLPAHSKILGVCVKHSEAFSGGSLSTMTVSVGRATAATDYTAAADIFAAVADTTLQETSMFKASTDAAVALLATFTGSHNVNTATAGSVDVYVCYLNVTG